MYRIDSGKAEKACWSIKLRVYLKINFVEYQTKVRKRRDMVFPNKAELLFEKKYYFQTLTCLLRYCS